MKPLLFVIALGAAGCLQAEQSASCKQFVACVHELDTRDGVTTDATRFEADGACWSNPTIADLCDQACTRGIAQLRTEDPALTCAVTP